MKKSPIYIYFQIAIDKKKQYLYSLHINVKTDRAWILTDGSNHAEAKKDKIETSIIRANKMEENRCKKQKSKKI